MRAIPGRDWPTIEENAMAAPGENRRVNADRLWDSLMEMRRSAPALRRNNPPDVDGCGRRRSPAFPVPGAKRRGSPWVSTRWAPCFLTRPGTDPGCAARHIGSHLDTQRPGGKVDGVLGVLSGLEAVRTMNISASRRSTRSVVTNWTNEEGALAPAMLASGVFAGSIPSKRYARKDPRRKRASAMN